MWRDEILPLSLGLIAAALAAAWLAQDPSPWPREELSVLSARPPAPDVCSGGVCWQPLEHAGLE